MSTYEFTFLLQDPKSVKQVEKVLTSFEGKKLKENYWGKRLLTFPINKVTAAEYFTWHVQMDPAKLKEFKNKLNYDKLMLRYIVLKQEDTSESSPAKEGKS